MPSIINSEKIALPSIKTKPAAWEEIRLYSRRLSQEFSVLDTSFDVYYRENPVRVPFLWESRPGTPKIGTRDFSVPPLTPPPSFHPTPISRKPSKKQPRNNLITRVFLPKLKQKKTLFDDSPSRSSISSFSSSSSSSSPIERRRVSSHPRMTSFGLMINEEDDECESPVSTLCFGRRCSIF